MTQNAKIAKLWSLFHRLPEKEKDLVLKTSETMAEAEEHGASDKFAQKASVRESKKKKG
jgi:hypothetical protein